MLRCNESEPWRPMGHILDLYVLPTTCLAGLLLNVACLIVFSRRIFRSQTPLRAFPCLFLRFLRRSHPLVPALMLLSVCDSLQLLCSLFVLFLPAVHDHLEMDPLGAIAQLAYIATGTLAGLLLTANCASIWTMCYITFQRHRAIVRPLYTVTHSHSNYKTGGQLLSIFVMALVFNLPVWFEFKWSIENVQRENGEWTWILWHTASNLAVNPLYRLVMRKILYPIAVYVIPLFVISMLNMRILSHIRKSRSAVETVSYRRRIEKEQRSVRLLISIVVLFFMCHTGGLIIRFIDHSIHENEPCFVFGKDLINFLFNVNSFANPMLYFIFTKQFKDLTINWAHSKKDASVTKRLLRRISSRSVSKSPCEPSPGEPSVV